MQEELVQIFTTELNFKQNAEFYNFLKLKSLKNNIVLTNEQILKYVEFLKFLVLWNKKTNLTSIVKFEDMVNKHIIDSLLVLKTFKLNGDENKLLDVGAGAGFPSTPIAILEIFQNVFQIDCLKKRVEFLLFIKKQLNLKTTPIHARAEELAKKENFKEKIDVVTARAVSKLNVLSELSIPFVKTDGFFVALKGPEYEADLNSAKNAIKMLGAKVEKIEKFKIENNSRTIILLKKISHTSTKYPRNYSKILKNPI